MLTNRYVALALLLVLQAVQRSSSFARFDQFSSAAWCSKFPDDEAREECKNTTGTVWVFSPTCCNAKFECIDGEYNQGLRCSVSGHVPDADSSMKCVEDASCVDTSGTTTTSTSTTTVQTTTTSATTTSAPANFTGQFCSSFPSSEPPIYCAEIAGPLWVASPSCCNVKFECLDGAYSQGFRCGSQGFVPDMDQFKCIEDSRCVSADDEQIPEDQDNPTDILCCNDNEDLLSIPSDCSRYAQCISGRLTLFQCLAGSIFNFQLQRCTPGNEVTCELDAS